MTRLEIAVALEEGMILESDDGTRYVAQENMCGGRYCCYIDNEEGHYPSKLTNSLEEAIAFVN